MSRALKLFTNATCPFCHRADLVAREKKLTLERVEIPLGDAMPKWYTEVNPREMVPTLQVSGKQYVYESDLISQFLDNISSPAGSLMGSTPYERHRIEFFMSQVGDLISAWYTYMEDPFNAEKRKAVDDNSKYIEDIIAEQQKSGGPYYLDDKMSMADIMVLPFLIRFEAVLGYFCAYDIFGCAPRLKKMHTAAMQRPTVKESTLTPEEYILAYKSHVPAAHLTYNMAPKHVLFMYSLCPFADRARLASAAKEVDLHEVDIDLKAKPHWYPWVNYRETVPTILTPQGKYVHESQLAVHYFEEKFPGQGLPLMPKDPEQAYFVRFCESNTSHFTRAMFSVFSNPNSKEAKEELEWAAGELEKELALHHFGAGPFFGGDKLNAADICLLPFLVRVKACTPELTGGYDLLAKFKLLAAMLQAGLESDLGKKVFKPLPQYCAAYKAKFRSS